jgi:hypothetical protein
MNAPRDRNSRSGRHRLDPRRRSDALAKDERDSRRSRRPRPKSNSTNGSLPGREAVRAAVRFLNELTGKEAESVSGLTRTEDGWQVKLEVVELERIPRTTDLLGSYVVQIDGHGHLNGCDRIRRYSRSHAIEE